MHIPSSQPHHVRGFCGYSIDFQEQLLERITKENKKQILIHVCKKDLPETKKELKKFTHKHYSVKELKEETYNLAPEFEPESEEIEESKELNN